MDWIQLIVAILGSGVLTAFVAGLLNIIGIGQTNKFNQQRFDNDRRLTEDKTELEKNKAAAQDLYRIIRGGLNILPAIEKNLKYSEIYNYKNLAHNIIARIERDDLSNIKDDLILFFNKLADRSKHTINGVDIGDSQLLDYFLNLIISNIQENGKDYQDFKARYMKSEYKSSASLGYLGWNYLLDINKLNADIDFVNQNLNLHLEHIQSINNE